MKKAIIEMHNGSPAIKIDGIAVPPMFMTSRSESHQYYEDLGKAGIKVFYIECNTDWLNPDEFVTLDKRIGILLKAIPDANIILRVALHPPMQWIKDNPGELVTYSDGSNVTSDPGWLCSFYEEGVPNVYSLASEKWRNDASAALIRFIGQVGLKFYGDHIIGYFLAAGGTSEWYSSAGTINREKNIYSDLSESFRKDFSRILKENYKTEEELKKAWQDEDASFENPTIPDLEAKYFIWVDDEVNKEYRKYIPVPTPTNGTNFGSFLDADKHQKIADFYQAWNFGTADSIIHFGEVIKKATDNSLLVGAFYGSYGCTQFLESSSVSGVLRILDSGCIDFLAAPGNYENRQPGGYTAQREMQDSFRLRKRMFIVEEDTRTLFSTEMDREFTGTYTLKDSLTVMKRDFGRNICEDLQAWWYDMAPEGGWYDHPEIMKLIKRQQEIASFAYQHERTKKNEIALIYDQESTRYASQKTTFDLCHWFRVIETSRIGAPVDYYFVDDLMLSNMPDYKLYIFINAFHLSDKKREVINQKVKQNGKVALWLYAQGFINPDTQPKLAKENIENLVGMKMDVLDGAWRPRFRLEDSNHKLLEYCEEDMDYGVFDRPVYDTLGSSLLHHSFLYPLFYPNDKDAKVLGTFLSSGKPALAIREFEDWTSVYCGTKTVRSDLLKSIAKFAGCHIFTDSDDCLYANQRFLVIHAKDSGEKSIYFPQRCDPYEVYENSSYGTDVSEIKVKMRAGETLMFHLNGVLE